jgi:hypothetical protein
MTIFEVASLGLLWWETSLDFNDPLAGYPGLVGLLGLGGSVLYGFIRPAIYAKNQRLAQMLDSIELAPVAHDKTGLKLVLQAPLE